MQMKSSYVKYGLISAIVSIIMAIIYFYLVDIGLLKYSLLTFGLMGVFMFLAGKEEKSNNGGTLPYGSALVTTFLTGFITIVVSTIFSILLFHVIDAGLIDVMTERAIESTRSMMESMGAPQESIEEALDNMESNINDSMSPSRLLLGLLSNGILILIIAAIISLFVRKEEPVV